MIQLTNIEKSFGARSLFTGITWRIKPGDRVGLIGPNGAGKTTLMKIVAGLAAPDSGEVSRLIKTLRAGFLTQETDESALDEPLLEEVLKGRQDILALEKELEDITDQLKHATGETAINLTSRLDAVHERFKAAGGFEYVARAKSILRGVGFLESDFHKPMRSFSGGWRTRARLAQILSAAPEILLLDEPTNHLDLESTEWLEKFLSTYQGAVVLISHDRYFLNRAITSIAELEDGQLMVYPFAYDRFVREKEAHRELLEKQASLQKREIEKQEKFIERFKAKASKATQAQSRVKALEKIERIEIRQSPKPVAFKFQETGRIGHTAVELASISVSYGDKPVLRELDFALRRGERIALVGPNGAGKSTLLKTIAGVIPSIGGKISFGANVAPSYFAQHQAETLDVNKTILDEVTTSIPFEFIPMARTCLGAFLFHGDDVHKKISSLSGGEKARVAMAKLALTPTNLLLLDEPTNHLDLQSRLALEKALAQYGGCILMISHDRAFIDAIANKVVRIDRGRLTEYHGGYAYYESRRVSEISGMRDEETDGIVSKASRKEIRRESAQQRQELNRKVGPLKQRLSKTEEEINRVENRIAELEGSLANPEIYQNPEEARSLAKELSDTKKRNDTLLAEWEAMAEEMESITAGHLA